MKIHHLLSLLFIFSVVVASEGAGIEELIRKVGALKVISGQATGVDGSPGEFYLLSEQILPTGTKGDFVRMTAKPAPAQRVMGAYCLIQKFPGEDIEMIRDLFDDPETIGWNPIGCTVWGKTKIGDIIKEMLRNPEVLRWSRPDIEE